MPYLVLHYDFSSINIMGIRTKLIFFDCVLKRNKSCFNFLSKRVNFFSLKDTKITKLKLPRYISTVTSLFLEKDSMLNVQTLFTLCKVT